VDHPFRHALAVELRHLLEQLPILDQERPAQAGGDRVLVVADRDAGGGGLRRTLAHWVTLRSGDSTVELD
jgi:hypothetical protein